MRLSILKHLREDTALLEQTVDMLQGKAIKTTPKIPNNLREDISNILGVPLPTNKGISPEFISGYCKLSGDPDDILSEWKIHGAPLGIINDVTPTGIFPPVAPADSTRYPLEDIASTPGVGRITSPRKSLQRLYQKSCKIWDKKIGLSHAQH